MIGQAAGQASEEANGTGRWRLNRAGIVNVYQYGNEVLNFAGGRLLLRGVNGSGKSTAMNMLLPFLLTTREGRIDAAGEQSGILKSWMLSGRDDAQPVGYLWIEFERGGEFAVCGCGIKANRQSERVSTWWFLTSKRPGIDLDVVSGGMALSSEALRAVLDGDKVFSERHKRDYRRAVEQRLFGGASIDQHIGLLNKVRSPRVGDRIDVDLRDYLVDALPRISERALTEAAQPLDDLEEHRRSVASMATTLDAIRGLLDVYRAYCQSDLRRRIAEGRKQLAARRDSGRDEQKRRRAAEAATAEISRLDAELNGLAGQERRLRREIDALVRSPAYERGQQLEDLRKYVRDLDKQCEAATRRVEAVEQRAEESAVELHRARRTARGDRDALNATLATARELAHRCGLDRRPSSPIALAEADEIDPAGSDRADPPLFDALPIEHKLDAAVAALARRRADTEQVHHALGAERSAEQRLEQSESTHNQAAAAAGQASARLAENTKRLGAAKNGWVEAVRRWAAETQRLLDSAGLDAPGAAAAQVGSVPRAGDEEPATGDPDALRARLYAEAETLVDHWIRAAGAVETRLARKQEAEKEAQELVNELAQRTEPAAPRLDWQSETDYCLADLVDFAPGLDDSQRAGLEAALQSSGLLSARPADGATQPEVGELAAVASHGVASPLSELLTVTVPPRLQGEVDEGSIRKLLESISYDPSADTGALATRDGAFRVGSLRGAHRKERAEHIGSTARLAALENARAEARGRLDEASEAVRLSRRELAGHRKSQQSAQRQRSILPTTEAILSARASVDAATAALNEAVARRDEAARKAAEAERALTSASDALHRTATTLSLPREREGLAAFERDLAETGSTLQQCLSQLGALGRSVQEWCRACARWRAAVGALEDERVELRQRQSRHDDEQATLATLEDSIGSEYAEVVADLDRCRAELEAAEAKMPRLRRERDTAFERKAGAQAEAKAAVERREQAERACEAARVSLDEALAAPGYLAAVRALASTTETGAAGEPTTDASATAGTKTARSGTEGAIAADGGEITAIVAAAAGSEGLREMLDALAPLVPPDIADVHPDSVYQSLRRRRDALGSGWDAEARQRDPALPLLVEVSGPSGTATLADSVRVVSQQHQQVAGLLSRKQDDALRELLQGLIASEIAQRIFDAERLVEHVNRRLGEVTTAHRVGVRLRWRRSRELDDATARMVELLSKRPDVRTEDEDHELRRALSGRLDDVRAEQPDVPYRQLIADTLDYKQWHDMAVMVRKGSDETRLSRSTPLSEGEKKLVTYLPLFAAASASYDALAEQQAAPGELPGIARFVLIDDAFAKVSEDNHAALFGLLVQFDLDFIATSERLWGTHGTVPALAVTEVVRDAALSTILLEHYTWDGNTLEREDVP